MGDLVSMSEARIARQRRKQAEIFNPAPFIEMQLAFAELVIANIRLAMAIYSGALRG